MRGLPAIPAALGSAAFRGPIHKAGHLRAVLPEEAKKLAGG
jgi:hypothetical protein